jgi:hypothetical protein
MPCERTIKRSTRSALEKSQLNVLLKKNNAANLAQLPNERVRGLDWSHLTEQLNGFGNAVIEGLLTPEECRKISSLYPDDNQFRSHVHMARHGFGKGEYKYFKYPLPDLLRELRTALYPFLAFVANAWNERMGIGRAAILNRMRTSSSSVMKLGRRGPRRCCCNMCRATSTACTKTSMEIWRFLCKSRSCSRCPARTSPVVNSC